MSKIYYYKTLTEDGYGYNYQLCRGDVNLRHPDMIGGLKFGKSYASLAQAIKFSRTDDGNEFVVPVEVSDWVAERTYFKWREVLHSIYELKQAKQLALTSRDGFMALTWKTVEV